VTAQHKLVNPGTTIAEILESVDPVHRAVARVYSAGVDVTDIEGFTTTPGEVLLVAVNPEGGGDKGGLLGGLLSIVVTAAAFYFAGPAGFGLTGTAFYATAAGLSMVGNLLIGALIPPPIIGNMGSGSPADPASYAITGQSNRSNPYGVVPRIYGRVKFYPLLAANPIVNNYGQVSRFAALYDFGYGDIDVDMSTLKIGETPAADFSPTLWLRRNTMGNELAVVTSQVDYQEFAVTLRKDVEQVVRTSPKCVRAELDLVFQRGLVKFNDRGIKQTTGVSVTVQWRSIRSLTWNNVDASAWYGISAQGAFSGISIVNGRVVPSANGTTVVLSGATTSAVTAVCNIVFPDAGDYDIRLVRNTVDSTDTKVVDEVTLTLLESFQPGPGLQLEAPHTMLEMEVRATDRLRGVVQNLSAVGTSVLRTTTDGLSFRNMPTRNPAWIAVDILTGIATPKPLTNAQIDWPSWIALANWCDTQVTRVVNGVSFTRARHSADFVVDYATTVQELLGSVLSGCRASLMVTRAGKYGVLIDAQQTVPRQLITPANSWGFQGRRTYADAPHALRVSYVDGDAVAGTGAQSWHKAEILVYRDGYNAGNATLIENLGTFGMTDYVSAWSFGRYMLAQGILRAETFTLNMDVENLVCQRGSLVYVAHDVPKAGGVVARVVKVQLDTITIDSKLSTAPTNYTVRTGSGLVRTGNIMGIGIDGDGFTLDNAGAISPGDLIVLGATSRLTEPYIVQQIRPGPDLTAELTLVAYDAAVYKVDTEAIPEWRPVLSGDLVNSTKLAVVNLSDVGPELVYINRRPFCKHLLKWSCTGGKAATYALTIVAGVDKAVIRISDITSQAYEWLVDVLENPTAVGDVSFTVTPLTGGGVAGTSASVLSTVIADTKPPKAPINFGVNVQDEHVVIFWTPSTDADVEFFEVRYSPDAENGIWAQSQLVGLFAWDAVRAVAGGRVGRYFIRVRDTSGNVSIILSRRTTIETLPNANIVDSINDAPGWHGEKYYMERVGGSLQVCGDAGYISRLAYYTFSRPLDFESVYELRISSKLRFHATMPDGSEAGAELYSVELEYRAAGDSTEIVDWEPDLTTDLADPISAVGDRQWGDWNAVRVLDVTALRLQFRIKIVTLDPRVRVAIDDGLVEIDAMDRRWHQSNVQVSDEGLRVIFRPPFMFPPAVAISLLGDSVARYRITNKNRFGFDLELFAEEGVLIAGQVDIFAAGQGVEGKHPL
jgi:hypothetical protein